MPDSPGSLDARACGTSTMRLASAAQHLSPGFSVEVNAVAGAAGPAADVCDSSGSGYQGQSRKSDTVFVSQSVRMPKHGAETCHEEAEEDQDDADDELVTLSIDEAISAVFDAAAGRSLPQQAREVLVPPSSQSSSGTGGRAEPSAAGGGAAAGHGGGASASGSEGQQQDVAGASGVLSENKKSLRQATRSSGMCRVPPLSSSGTTTSEHNSFCGSSNGLVSSDSDVSRPSPPFEGNGGGGSGGKSFPPLRRLLWLRLLGVLQDADPLKWAQQLRQQRAAYVRLQEEEERQLSAKRLTSLDPQRFHPLAATADNPWSQRQQNEALLLEIWKDVERTLAERPLFRSDATRKALQRILFTWSRRNPEVSYKQGMNELLAIFYLVCYREKLQVSSQGFGPSSSSSSTSKSSASRSSKATFPPTSSGYSSSVAGSSAAEEDPQRQQECWGQREAAVQVLLSPDPAAVEADSFALFDAVMNRFMLKAAYLPAPSPPATTTAAGGGGGGGTSLLHKGSTSSSGRFLGGGAAGMAGGGLRPLVMARSPAAAPSKSALLWRCSYIFETLLPVADRPLYEHLKSEEVEPQLFLLRWMRLLFSREFHIEDTLLLWDAVFADAYLHEAIERGGHTPSYSCRASPPQPPARHCVSASAAPTYCADTEARTAAAGSSAAGSAAGALRGPTASPAGPMQQQQQQQLSDVEGVDRGSCCADPFRSLLRCSVAPAGTAAGAEVMYDAEQLGAAAAAKLPLVDYFVLAMLKYVRATLLESNQILCLRRLLRFPPTESIQPLVLLAVSLRTRRLPHSLGRSSITGATASPQSFFASSVEQQGTPPFPSSIFFCTQPQAQQRQQQQQMQGQHQQVHEQQQQQQEEEEEAVVRQAQLRTKEQQQLQQQDSVAHAHAVGPGGADVPQLEEKKEEEEEEQQQQQETVAHAVRAQATASEQHERQQQEISPVLRMLQQASPCRGTETAFFASSPAAPAHPGAAGAAATQVSKGDTTPRMGRDISASLCTHKREDLLRSARLSAAAAAATSPFPAVAAAGGSEQALAAADMSRRGDITTASSSSNNSNSCPGAARSQPCKSRIVNIKIRSSAAAEASAMAAGTSNSSSSSGSVEEQSETETCGGDVGSTIVAGRTISKHVEEVAADLRAALALWSSKELLAHQSNSRDVMRGAPAEETAVQQTFSSYAQRMQAAEERIAAALVRLQLLHRVLEGDIAYSSSLFPSPAAGSSLCEAARAAGTAATGPVEGAAGAALAAHVGSNSRNEYVGRHLAGERAATPASVP